MSWVGYGKKLFFSIFLLLVFLYFPAPAETLVVGGGDADFNSIAKAIEAAASGDTVLMRKGTYEVNLGVQKEITLKAEAKGEVTLRGSEDGKPVLRVGPSETEVTLIDLKLTGGSGELCDNRGKGICPDGMVLTGEASVIARDSSFVNNGKNGIRLVDSSRLGLYSSYVSGNEGSGIRVSDSAKVTFDGGKVANNGNGFSLVKSARAEVSNVDLVQNSGYGFFLFGNSRLDLSDSCLKENGKAGLRLENSSRAEVTASTVTGNKGRGVWIEGRAELTMQDSQVTGNQVGVTNYSDFPVDFYDNRISGNDADLVGDLSGDLRTELTPRKAEKITLPDEDYSGIQSAVDALEPGGKLYIKGKVSGHAVVDKKLLIKSKGDVSSVLTGSGKSVAPLLSLLNGAKVKVTGLELTNPNGTGVVLGGNAELSLLNSKLAGSAGGGVELYDSTVLTLAGSEVKNNGRSGIRLVDSASLSVRESQVGGNGTDNVLLAGASSASIRGSTFSKGKGAGIGIYDAADLSASGSEFSGNEGNGVRLTSSANANLKNCELSGNGLNGIALSTASRIDLNGNKIVNNENGVSLRGSSELSLVNTSLKKNSTALKVRSPDQFGGSIEGKGNQFTENGSDFAGVTDSIRDKLTE